MSIQAKLAKKAGKWLAKTVWRLFMIKRWQKQAQEKEEKKHEKD